LESLPSAARHEHLSRHVTPNLNVTRIRNRVIEIVNSGGAKGLWFAALAEVGYRRLVVREFSLRSPVEQAAARIEVDISHLDERDLEAYTAFRNPSDPHAARKRLQNGDVCFVARHKDKGVIVCACWVSTEKAWNAYLSTPIPLASDEAYAYDLFTDPEWRGRNIPAAVTSAMHCSCRARGLTRIIGLSIRENQPAMTQSIGNHRRFFQRMNAGERAPGQNKTEDPQWDASVTALMKNGHYLDDFLANMKRSAYIDLVEHWGGVPLGGWVLKTDLFEEAMGPDAFLLDLPGSPTKLIGMDLSGLATSMAREKDAFERASYVRADIRALPFSDRSIDMIISPSTLDHFADAGDLDLSLNELRRVLVCGGRMIVTLDNRQNVFDPLLRLVNMLGGVPYYLGKSYSVGELRGRLDKAGFDVVDTAAIIHHPRLVGVASVAIANRLGSKSITTLVRSVLLRMQKLQGTRLQYFSGCFVAALAVPKVTDRSSGSGRIESSIRMDRAE